MGDVNAMEHYSEILMHTKESKKDAPKYLKNAANCGDPYS